MAISGATATDVTTYAQKYGLARKQVADIVNLTDPPARTVVLTDAGSHVGSLAFTNFEGEKFIDWGDGTITHGAFTSPQTHTYVAGTYAPRVTAAGYTKAATGVAIA